MGIYAGGQEFSKTYAGGVEFTGALAGGEAYLADAAAPTGLLGYPLDFWAELVVSDAQQFVPKNSPPSGPGQSVWLRTSDGLPLEQEFLENVDTWRGSTTDAGEPDELDSAWIPFRDHYRFRKTGLPWVPSDAGVRWSTTQVQIGLDAAVAWPANGVYRFFSADQPGTLTHGATRRQRGGINLACVISDPDGIASIDAAQLDSTDGRTNDITANWVRRDANSFTHADERPGNRWREASVTVTYTDGNGVQSTLTDSWDV